MVAVQAGQVSLAILIHHVLCREAALGTARWKVLHLECRGWGLAGWITSSRLCQVLILASCDCDLIWKESLQMILLMTLTWKLTLITQGLHAITRVLPMERQEEG